MNQSNFQIYNASAGSGKTFTLVKDYLKILFASSDIFEFKNILAITFTNKAVAEMKARIILMLKEFSKETILKQPNDMFNELVNDLNIDPKLLHLKAKTILNTIVHNYASLDVSTIDRFNHRVVRTFAYDLKLALNFEVELDQDALLSEAVNSLISKAGTNKKLTDILVDFAIEKVNDNKSWDITFDFNNIAKLLVRENDIPHLNSLKEKTPDDFKDLKSFLKKELNATEKKIITLGNETLTLIEECGLEHEDFSGGSRAYFPNYLKKLIGLNLNIGFSANWILKMEDKPLYSSKLKDDLKQVLDDIQPTLVSFFKASKKLVFHHKFLTSFYKNITPLSVLNAINQELQSIKLEQNKLLISEFNTIINSEITKQPTPFIYERLGEKFRHYFIDEFQDTSTLQWSNLIPLIGNVLSSENLKGERGTAMLVGDAKQAIYRWRGGDAEQFINLFSNISNPFQVEQTVENLPTNYRSFKEIIEFNNSFFTFLSDLVFSDDAYASLYKSGASQHTSIQEKGCVQLSFLDINKDDDQDLLYCQNVMETIKNCIANGFKYQDICILVRKKKQGVSIANYLSDHDIQITSSETMLINNAPEINCINEVLKLLLDPTQDTKIKILSYLASIHNIDNKHQFYSAYLPLNIKQFFKNLETLSIFFNPNTAIQLPLYDLVETIIRAFNFSNTSNAFIQFYLDVVLDFTQKQRSGISEFLDYYDSKKELLSIVSPQGLNAIQIMTIHKSKGLEFPVVIFPYADLNIYEDQNPKEWFPLDKKLYKGFSSTLLNYKKDDFKNFGAHGEDIYNVHQSKLELDHINLLYVALTRPIEQLHIISKKDISSSGVINTKSFAGLLLQYLNHIQLYNQDESNYKFGNSEKSNLTNLSTNQAIIAEDFISTAKESHNINIVTKSGFLWDTDQKEAIEKGNLIHDIMSKIYSINDIEIVIKEYVNSGTINQFQAKELTEVAIQIVSHPSLKILFDVNQDSYNERDIITPSGEILRPDRLVFHNTSDITIIDYKTGVFNPKHKEQLQNYQDILEDMSVKVSQKILVYISDSIEVVSV